MNAPVANTVPLRAVRAPSEKYLNYLQRDRARRRHIRIAQALLLAVFLCAWEILPRMHILNPLLTSYPSALWPTFIELWNNGQLGKHIMTTLSATLVGFGLSMAIGIVVAAALWWSDFLYKVLDPFLVVANAMPKIAFVPIFYLWLGSDYAVYGMAVAIAVFVTIMVIYAGFRGIDLNKVKLAHTFGASRWQVLTKVVLPGSVPTLIAAVKMNIGLALVGVIVGEFQSADSGLGFLIMNGSQVFKLNIVMTAIAILALISSVMYLIVYRIEAAIARRYG
ncbi:binding-protein-dependent transport system inner membrane component family protein 8 [Achromobacter xylosoxidans A8]|uniref:Binding-protein-dependent transport system inner membrane component family protein 8 n=1 Tax=Achromobacter xylosoxidans (strain A8) TaxID=762376 RepID=E3HE97_ACHXA|nr:ABC transporter permease [Achromobacter xylosoxidans]ADP14007.1 binding-protein-dependent transport system inner membrane component family protein 8 [Achromobacter xylosoxidans A8]